MGSQLAIFFVPTGTKSLRGDTAHWVISFSARIVGVLGLRSRDAQTLNVSRYCLDRLAFWTLPMALRGRSLAYQRMGSGPGVIPTGIAGLGTGKLGRASDLLPIC